MGLYICMHAYVHAHVYAHVLHWSTYASSGTESTPSPFALVSWPPVLLDLQAQSSTVSCHPLLYTSRVSLLQETPAMHRQSSQQFNCANTSRLCIASVKALHTHIQALHCIQGSFQSRFRLLLLCHEAIIDLLHNTGICETTTSVHKYNIHPLMWYAVHCICLYSISSPNYTIS